MITLTNIRCMSESSDAFASINVDDSQLIIESYISSINEAGNDGGVWNKIKKVCKRIIDFILGIIKRIKDTVLKLIKDTKENLKNVTGGSGSEEYYQLNLNTGHPGIKNLNDIIVKQMFANANSEINESSMFDMNEVKDAQNNPERAKALAAAYNEVLKNKETFKFSAESDFWRKEFGIDGKKTEYGTQTNIVSGKKTKSNRDTMLKNFADFINKADSATETISSELDRSNKRVSSCIKPIESFGNIGSDNDDNAFVSYLKAKLSCISNYASAFCGASSFLTNDINAATQYCVSATYDKRDQEWANNISVEFKDAVQKKNLLLVRIMLKDSLYVDISQRQFKERLKYATQRLPDLFVPHDGEKFNYDKSAWTKSYMGELLVRVINNFSKERLEFLQKIIPYVYRDTAKSIDNRRKEKIKNGHADWDDVKHTDPKTGKVTIEEIPPKNAQQNSKGRRR